jgi:hypothetical protein
MYKTVRQLPEASKDHATCAWCGLDFATIIELIDHADARHLATAA